MMKQIIRSILVLTMLFGNLQIVYAEENNDNLYTAAFNSKGAGIVVGTDKKIVINYSRTSESEEEYQNFFSNPSDTIIPGKQYLLNYTIDVTAFTGDPAVYISSSGGNSQLGDRNEVQYIWQTGKISNEYFVTAQDIADNNGYLLRSYANFPMNSSLECTIEINVLPIEVTATVDSYQIGLTNVGDEKYLFLPSSANTNNLFMCGSVTLCGETSKKITLATQGEKYDLDALFNEKIEPGKDYSVDVYIQDKQLETIHIMKASGLSSIYIISDKTVSELNAKKSVEGKGALSMVDKNGKRLNRNDALKKIKGRGNSTWESSGEKKPYNITLEEKTELIPGAGAAGKWCLISDNCIGEWIFDGNGLANIVTYDLYNAIGGAYGVSCEAVNLYINGEYRGVYLLTEKVEIGSERVNVKESSYALEDELQTTTVLNRDGLKNSEKLPQYWQYVAMSNSVYASAEDAAIASGIQAYQYATGSVLADKTTSGGFLLELDRNFYGEACWFVTRRGYPYTIKEPEFATKEQVQQIAAYVQEYEDAVFSDTGYNSQGKYYADYIDMESFAKELLVDMASAQTDTFISSCFFSVDTDENGSVTSNKIVAGPAWDYDGANYFDEWGMALDGSSPVTNGYTNQRYMVAQLMKHGDFTSMLNEMGNGILIESWRSILANKLENYISSMQDSQTMNTVRWNTDDETRDSDPADFASFRLAYNKRFTKWPSFWNGNKLNGVTIKQDNKILTASAPGLTSPAYQWLKLSEDRQSFTELANETNQIFRPNEDGIYCVRVTGPSVTRADVPVMYSNPIEIGETEDPQEPPKITADNPFVDVNENDLFYDAVMWVYEKGLMSGTDKTMFSPQRKTTRGMIVTILYRMEGEPVVNYAMTFKDVAADQWYTEAIRWATSNNIVMGYSDEIYAPGDYITREQFAAILYRYAKFKGYDVSGGEDTNILSYEDATSISEYAIPAIQWTVGASIMRGMSNDKLAPLGKATRAQVAIMITKLLENV